MWITQLFKKLLTVHNLDKLIIFLLITLRKLDIMSLHPFAELYFELCFIHTT